MAQHYSTSRGNLAQMRYGLGRSEPEISAYSRFDRRGSSILDIFNESPSPKPPASPRRLNRYQKFQDAENGDVDSKPNEKKEVIQPKNEQMRKVLAEHNELHQSGSGMLIIKIDFKNFFIFSLFLFFKPCFLANVFSQNDF